MDASTGTLFFVDKETDTGGAGVDGLYGLADIVISPDGKRLYVASRNDDAVAIFDRNTTNGVLNYISMIKDGVGGVDGLNGARAITMDPNGDYVYVASQLDDALVVFSRNPINGSLTYFTSIKDTDAGIDGLNTANGIAISPSGHHIYVASYDDDAVSVFAHFWGVFMPMVVRDG